MRKDKLQHTGHLSHLEVDIRAIQYRTALEIKRVFSYPNTSQSLCLDPLERGRRRTDQFASNNITEEGAFRRIGRPASPCHGTTSSDSFPRARKCREEFESFLTAVFTKLISRPSRHSEDPDIPHRTEKVLMRS
jgi:hypothetical protein